MKQDSETPVTRGSLPFLAKRKSVMDPSFRTTVGLNGGDSCARRNTIDYKYASKTMLFDKKAEKTDPNRKKEASPKKYDNEIEKKLKRFDDLLRKNYEAYQRDIISNAVYKKRHEKLIK